MKVTGLNISKNAQQQNKVAEVKDFLKENYEIRVNQFDPSKSVIKALTKNYQNPVTFADISLHLLEDGISVSDTVLRKILSSPNQIETYDPIAEYFESLKGKYKGVSHIDRLMSHLRMREYPGYGRDFFQNRMYRLMKKWFVATAACALKIWPNDVFMGLVHADEGIGKTYFFNFILPEPLKNMIADPSDNAKFNLEESFARKFLIYFDEMAGITQRNTDTLKKMASARNIDVYLPREVYPVTMPRIGSGCFSSNRTPENGGFLTTAMGKRRWLVFELDSINQEYSKKVDVDQLWAEALLLIDQDFDFRWTPEDWDRDFKEINNRYMKETTSVKYLKLNFDYPMNGEGEWLQPKEIMDMLISGNTVRQKLRREDIQKVSVVEIGKALTALNFDRKKIRKANGPRECYYVSTIN